MTSTDQDISLIAHVIQLAVAPVFLLTGLGALLSVMTNRLSRVIDRARLVEGMWTALGEAARTGARGELGTLARRAHLASWAINFCIFSGLLVCGVIGTLFLDALLGTQLKWLVSVLFIGSMIAVIGGLVSFLGEVYLATHTLRIGPPPVSDSAVSSSRSTELTERPHERTMRLAASTNARRDA
jgi:hypothetical protein